jgi:hypothetical protein
MALFRGMCHLDLKYSAVSVREAKYTCLGHRTRLSMLGEKLKHISSLLRLGDSVDAFLGAWTSSVHPLVG